MDQDPVPKTALFWYLLCSVKSYEALLGVTLAILTVERALFVNCIMSPAYCTVVELSRVERIGMPE